MSIKRIAIFQYDWPLQSYSRDLAIMFTQQGYQVDFLGYNLNVGDFISETSMFQSDLDLIQFSTIETAYLEKNKIFYNVTNKLKFRNYKCRSNYLFNSNHIKIDRKVLLDSYHFIKKNDYAFSIGIEKQGLIWAGLIGEKLNIPAIYYSLELYIEAHPMLQHLGHLRPAEAYFHQQTLATIIQDKSRQKALFEANSVDSKAVYLPVSVPGPAVLEKSDFLHKTFHINPDKKIALFFGGMAPQRYCEEIIDAAQNLRDDIVVIFHGFEMTEGYISFLKDKDFNNKVIFSLDRIPEEKLTELLSSADIGFAIYSNDNVNDRYTAFSSQKIALFLKHGLPVIANTNESYSRLFCEFKCGRSITEKESITQAITTLCDNISIYRKEAFMAFDKYFNIDQLKSEFMTQIDEIIN